MEIVQNPFLPTRYVVRGKVILFGGWRGVEGGGSVHRLTPLSLVKLKHDKQSPFLSRERLLFKTIPSLEISTIVLVSKLTFHYISLPLTKCTVHEFMFSKTRSWGFVCFGGDCSGTLVLSPNDATFWKSHKDNNLVLGTDNFG